MIETLAIAIPIVLALVWALGKFADKYYPRTPPTPEERKDDEDSAAAVLSATRGSGSVQWSNKGD